MKDFENLQRICLEEVRAAGIEPGNIVKWTINRRAKSRWGLCIRHRNGACEIQIASVLLEDERVSEAACKDTMIHEILHSCKGGNGHTGKWKEYAEIMNQKYGYHIKRQTSGEEKGLENYRSKSNPVRYYFKCTGCGQMVMRKRKCDFTKYYKRYVCAYCGKRFKRVKEPEM